jgi:crotonobetainyl-CoA:carnitine CoA-transferase CaiB-like acyl-CoA transferase
MSSGATGDCPADPRAATAAVSSGALDPRAAPPPPCRLGPWIPRGAIGRADLAEDASLATPASRIAENGRVDAVVAAWTRERPTAEAIGRLRGAKVACGPVRDIDALKAWPQLAARGMLEPLRHPTLGPWPQVVAPSFPLKFGSTEVGYATPAPLVGSGNQAIWGDLLGFDVAGLRMRGAI